MIASASSPATDDGSAASDGEHVIPRGRDGGGGGEGGGGWNGPEPYYWCLISAPAVAGMRTRTLRGAARAKGAPSARPIPPGLLPDIQEQLPVPVETVHAVVMALPRHRGGEASSLPDEPVSQAVSQVVVCAAERTRLADLAPGTLTHAPSTLPDFLSNRGVSPSDFNLLVGEFEPTPVTRRRALRHLRMAVLVVLGAALLAAGLLRRAEHAGASAQSLRAARASLLAGAELPDDGRAIAHRLDRARRIHAAALQIVPPTPVDDVLGELLRAWPARVPSTPQSLRVSGNEMTAAVVLDADPAPFLTAFGAAVPPGWSLEEPRLNTAGGVTRVTLRLIRSSGPSGSKPGGGP